MPKTNAKTSSGKNFCPGQVSPHSIVAKAARCGTMSDERRRSFYAELCQRDSMMIEASRKDAMNKVMVVDDDALNKKLNKIKSTYSRSISRITVAKVAGGDNWALVLQGIEDRVPSALKIAKQMMNAVVQTDKESDIVTATAKVADKNANTVKELILTGDDTVDELGPTDAHQHLLTVQSEQKKIEEEHPSKSMELYDVYSYSPYSPTSPTRKGADTVDELGPTSPAVNNQDSDDEKETCPRYDEVLNGYETIVTPTKRPSQTTPMAPKKQRCLATRVASDVELHL